MGFQLNAFQSNAFQGAIVPYSIESEEAFGAADITVFGGIRYISPPSIETEELVYNPSFSGGGVFIFVISTAIESGQALGTPALVRFTSFEAITIYGTGLRYGEDHLYGRIDAGLAVAQSTPVRQTALKVSVIKKCINDWSELAGSPLPLSLLATKTPAGADCLQDYYGYRLGMSMCILGDGTIVRVRVGDGTQADRNIYYQVITDPSIVSQWTSWSLLYSGAHYAVAVTPATSSTYNVYSAKSDGLYKNNVVYQVLTNIISISPVQGQTDAMYIIRVSKDANDGKVMMQTMYSSNMTAGPFSLDEINYRWRRTQISALKLSDGRIAKLQVAGFRTDPRSTELAESIAISFAASYASGGVNTGPPRIIRGFIGQAGRNSFINPYITYSSTDNFYYVFYGEARFDADNSVAISVPTLFWQRSKDLVYWSEPVAIGYSNMNPTGIGLVEIGGYAYLANNGATYRRPLSDTSYEISNYVPTAVLQIPRENQEASGAIEVANPNGVNNSLLTLADQEIKVEVGIKTDDGYSYTEVNKWWIGKPLRTKNLEADRISLSIYDLWRRLDNPLRDIYNFIGQVSLQDFCKGGRNKLFNYYIKACSASYKSDGIYVSTTKVVNTSFILYAGWRGHNGTASVKSRGAHISSTSGKKFGVVFRYKDARNYYWAYLKGNYVYLVRCKSGTTTTITSAYCGSGKSVVKVDFKWIHVKVYVNNTLEIDTDINEDYATKPGYVGVKASGVTSYNWSGFSFTDWEVPINTNDLVRTALAMGDFHEPIVAAGTDQQMALVWGPQTDLNSPATALKSLCDQYKLSIAWRNGTIQVGQFKEIEITKTLENELISLKLEEETGKRINLSVVDGQEDSYIQIDGEDSRRKSHQIVSYFDLPELKDDDAVRNRAQEEIRKGILGVKYTCSIPFLFDVWRMDCITVVDNDGVSNNHRVEGLEIDINQSTEPSQRATLDLSPLSGGIPIA